MTNEERKIQETVARIIERHRMESRINPAWIATEALHEIDPHRLAPHWVHVAAHLQLRQTARALLRQNVEGDEAEHHELFPGLQKRYPTARCEDRAEPEYVLLEFMTKEDVAYNVQRLRREAVAKRKHAEALEAWGERQFRVGAA